MGHQACLESKFGVRLVLHLNYFAYRHIVVIGSGIAVTPLLSVWKHLAKSDLGPEDPPERRLLRTSTMVALRRIFRLSPRSAEELLVTDGDMNYMDIVTFGSHHREAWRTRLVFYASVLESTTVNACLFVFSILMETLVICIFDAGMWTRLCKPSCLS